MKSVLFLVVHTRRHKILFLYSFTSCILQWHWHIMMLIQPCTTPALCIIKLSVSSLKRLHGISNQLSEWVLPFIILYSQSYSSTLYFYISESLKCRKKPKEPQTPGHKSNQTKYGVCYSYLYILWYYSDSCRSNYLLEKEETTLFQWDEYLSQMFIFNLNVQTKPVCFSNYLLYL